nr:cytochrome P450 monooxygenase CYP4BN53 [Lasioderma serricorne]
MYTHIYGGFFKTRIGPISPILFVSDVKIVEWLLSSNKHIQKAFQYKFLSRWLGLGLLTSTGNKWRTHRKIITPAFHFKILEDFIGIFNKASDILVEKLKNEVGKDSFDVYPYISLCTLDVICESAMGTEVKAQEHSDSEYVQSVREMGRIVAERAVTIKTFDFIYKFTKDYRTEKRCLQVLHDYTNNVIKNRRKEIEQTNYNEETTKSDEYGRKRKLAFLDLLIKESIATQNYLSDTELREEVDTFMFEGHDTTASAISFLLYSLSMYPDVQKKVVDELDQIFADDPKRQPTYQDIQDMKYLEMVIKETLRLYPSVPVYGRELVEDDIIAGVKVPKGTTIAIAAFATQRNPRLFQEPERFLPERFDSNNKLASPYAFIPFSAGPRNCIGQKFAIFEMKSTVSKILRHYEILKTEPIHLLLLTVETILKSENGIQIALKERIVKS